MSIEIGKYFKTFTNPSSVPIIVLLVTLNLFLYSVVYTFVRVSRYR